MAQRKKAPDFRASMKMTVELEVKVAGSTWEEALAAARKLTAADVLENFSEIVDHEGVQISWLTDMSA